MTDAEIVSMFLELVRDAKHKNIHIEVDDYKHEFHVYDYTEKPPALIGNCTSINEVVSIINNAWYDPITKQWHAQ